MPSSDPRAHAAVQRALKKGTLVRPDVCEECGKPPKGKGKLHAHHRDYDYPLDVEWLCPKCHRARPLGDNGREDGPTQILVRLGPERKARFAAAAAAQGVSMQKAMDEAIDQYLAAPAPADDDPLLAEWKRVASQVESRLRRR